LCVLLCIGWVEMFDDIVDMAMDQQLLSELNKDDNLDYSALPVWKELHAQTAQDVEVLHAMLENKDELTLEYMFNEPIGYYWLKSFLDSQHSVDKAIFFRDVQIFKTLHDADARNHSVHQIFTTFCGPEDATRVPGVSALLNIIHSAHLNPPDTTGKKSDKSEVSMLSRSKSHTELSNTRQYNPSKVMYEITELSSRMDASVASCITDPLPQSLKLDGADQFNLSERLQSKTPQHLHHSNVPSVSSLESPAVALHDELNVMSANAEAVDATDDTNATSTTDVIAASNAIGTKSESANAIGVYGKPLKNLRAKIHNNNDGDNFSVDIFDEIVDVIFDDFRLDIFPRFLQSTMFDMYLRCKSLELKPISLDSFASMRMLGRGAFGSVNACKKRDTGKLYAMKTIDQRRVQATESVHAVLAERDFLARMDSVFVTTLKYAFMDHDRLYLVMDLMTGGDLKWHLNRDGLFEESRARFYCAQVLLGLQHIHEQNIIYRDLKLENILVNEHGNVKISDLGLAVSLDEGLVRGYAGTPGYTAPEVVLTQYYDQNVDFFSLGVVIYRCICGKKPFAPRKNSQMRMHENDKMKKASIELDRNVVEMIPVFDHSRFTRNAKNICRALMHKNPEQRLGAEGFDQIKQHPWFDCIDWDCLNNGLLKPPFVPAANQIYAEQQQFIGRPPDDDKYAKIKITNEFNESLQEFAFTSTKVIQSELVDVLNAVHTQRKMSSDYDANDVQQIYAFPAPRVKHKKHSNCMGGCILL